MRDLYCLFLSAWLAVIILGFPAASSAKLRGVTLQDAYLRRISTATCGFLKNIWQPGELKNDKFFSWASRISDGTKRARKLTGKPKARLLRQIKSWKKKKIQQLPFCRTVADPTKVSSLLRLPLISEFVASADESVQAGAVTGTAPALRSFIGSDIKGYFWDTGVIEALAGGTQTPDQCSKFSHGTADGDRSGAMGCNLVGHLGYSLTPILKAGMSLCYLQRTPSDQIVGTGALSLVKGAFPNSDPKQLFEPPQGDAPRMVKLTILNSNQPPFFVRVFPAAQNAAEGNEFRAETWTCYSGRAWADNHQSLAVTSAKQYIYRWQDNEGSSSKGFQFTVTAGLKLNSHGRAIFDDGVDRTALASFLDPDDAVFGFKSDITVTGGNVIKNKNRWLFPGSWNNDFRVAQFSGRNISNLSYLHGSRKAEDHPDGGPVNAGPVSSVEFRDSFYAHAPQETLAPLAEAVNFGADPFYADPPSVNIDLSAYGCAPDTDIELTLDASNGTVATMLQQCEANTLWDTDICSAGTELTQANNTWQSQCPH